MFRATFSVGAGRSIEARSGTEPCARGGCWKSRKLWKRALCGSTSTKNQPYTTGVARYVSDIFNSRWPQSLSHVPNATCARGLTGHTWKTRKCFMVRSFACHAVMYYQTRVRPAWSAETGTETQSLPTARSRYRTTIPERIGGRTLFPCPRA